MTHRYLRYAILGVRILFPTRSEARYARAIKASGLFDREWYLASNPRLPWLCRLLPERHYVLVGEEVGICPSPDFSPRAYVHLNPDLPAGIKPFDHYIANGRVVGRAAHDLPAGTAAPALPPIHAQARPDPAAPFAVVLHLYYPEMWEEIASRLRQQHFRFDLFVTLTQTAPDTDATRARILADFPQARIWTLPNHGRDILPFLHLARSEIFAPYAAVCKLHSKKSPHRSDGDSWRHALLEGVIGPATLTERRLQTFLADPAAGLWVADGHKMAGAQWWGPNRKRSAEMLARVGLTLEGQGTDLVFAAGSIYWIKLAALWALQRLPITSADFEVEMGQVDGTTAHALERVFGLILAAERLQIRQACELDRQSQTSLADLKKPED